ncbi:hypothetical protein EZ428_17740 [Pedobacter frigiditerrae]|uniref:Uncharacterized protein n=1 Tax=Pedobacter frigiditerrae TaxID=2530452 RepID=A0A4R0MUG2_9SPHI|nr:hypothetical protein [Pedobacter frigiditerrae]TCC89534.1 hypothetical protein EZ428_17740 [Pedobacter frigiditerrae]
MKSLITFCFFLCICCGCQKKEKQFLLRLSYSKGDVFDIIYHSYAIADDDKYKEVLTNSEIKMKFTVDSLIGDSAYLFSSKILYIKMRNVGRFGEMMYLSRDKIHSRMSNAEKELHLDLDPLLDSTFTIMINKQGEILKSFMYKSGKPAGLLIDYENCQIPFPKDSISIGKEWENERIIPVTTGKRKSIFHINRVQNSKIEIGVEGYLNIYPKSNIKNKFSGLYVIDSVNNKLKSAELYTEINLFLKGKGKNTLVIKSRNVIDK